MALFLLRISDSKYWKLFLNSNSNADSDDDELEDTERKKTKFPGR